MSDIGYGIHVFVCENERPDEHPRGSCTRRGSKDIGLWFKDALVRHGIKSGNRINRAGCLDYCEQGPVVVIYGRDAGSGSWYAPRSRDDVEAIVREHLVLGQPVERLLLRLEV